MWYIISDDLWFLPAFGGPCSLDGPFASSLLASHKVPTTQGEPDLRCNASISQHLLPWPRKPSFPVLERQNISLADRARGKLRHWKLGNQCDCAKICKDKILLRDALNMLASFSLLLSENHHPIRHHPLATPTFATQQLWQNVSFSLNFTWFTGHSGESFAGPPSGALAHTHTHTREYLLHICWFWHSDLCIILALIFSCNKSAHNRGLHAIKPCMPSRNHNSPGPLIGPSPLPLSLTHQRRANQVTNFWLQTGERLPKWLVRLRVDASRLSSAIPWMLECAEEPAICWAQSRCYLKSNSCHTTVN